jgi:hypothetical protein
MNRPYCYALYNVRYVPQSRVGLMASEPERLRNIHMRTEQELLCQTRPVAEGTARILFVVRHAHYWTKGVILHADRAPVLPTSSTVSPLLWKVRLSAARRALSKGGVGSLVEPVHKEITAAKGGSSGTRHAHQSSTKGGSASKTTTAESKRGIASTKGGARVTCSTSPRRAPACHHTFYAYERGEQG